MAPAVYMVSLGGASERVWEQKWGMDRRVEGMQRTKLFKELKRCQKHKVLGSGGTVEAAEPQPEGLGNSSPHLHSGHLLKATAFTQKHPISFSPNSNLLLF